MIISEHKINQAKKLPPPNSGVVVVPLDLLPAYIQIYGVEPGGYKEEKEVLLLTAAATASGDYSGTGARSPRRIGDRRVDNDYTSVT